MKPEQIIHAVCYALELDRDKLFANPIKKVGDKGQFTKARSKDEKYADAECIAAFLMRQKALVPKTSKRFGTEMKSPTYKEIAYIFKKKAHKTVMDWELEAHIALRDKKPEFKAKYELVINLLEKPNNLDIA